jgi:type I restriction enzyme S subunit
MDLLDRWFTIADQLGMVIESAIQRSAVLRQAILKKAFEGKLVPQDPNDEPASVLLERLRAARAEAPPRRTLVKRKSRA